MMVQQTIHDAYDVAVVGGGPAGAVAAMSLARMGRSALLLESSKYDSPRVGETIPPSVREQLYELGVSCDFESLASTPSYGTRSAWGGDDLAEQSFVFNPHGAGWHVDRCRFDRMLADAAVRDGARVIVGAHVANCDRTDAGWSLTYGREGQRAETRARAIIDATGRKSSLAKRLGGRRDMLDRLVGVAAHFSAPPSPGGFTLVEAVEDGWWYSAPIPGDRLVVIFMSDSDLLRPRQAPQLAPWLVRLRQTHHTADRCRGGEPIWGPCVFSAASHRLRVIESTAPWLAVGDAALGVDPLSSSGISRALKSAQRAASVIDRWLDGDNAAHVHYETELDEEYAEYRRLKGEYYAMETRWPDAPFWKRRVVTADSRAPSLAAL